MILKFIMRDAEGEVVAGTPTVTADGDALTPTDETGYWTVDAPLGSLVTTTLTGAVPLDVQMPLVDGTTLAATGDAMTLTEAYDNAKADVLTPLAEKASQASVDAIPTTPLLADDYIAPDNATVAAIAADYAKTGEAATAVEGMSVDVDLTATNEAIAAVAAAVAALPGADPNAVAWTYELGEDRDGDGDPDRDEGGALLYPIADVRVYATATNDASAPIVADGYTSSAGAVTLLLAPGAYYLWRSKSGYRFSNPDQETVAAPE